MLDNLHRANHFHISIYLCTYVLVGLTLVIIWGSRRQLESSITHSTDAFS